MSVPWWKYKSFPSSGSPSQTGHRAGGGQERLERVHQHEAEGGRRDRRRRRPRPHPPDGDGGRAHAEDRRAQRRPRRRRNHRTNAAWLRCEVSIQSGRRFALLIFILTSSHVQYVLMCHPLHKSSVNLHKPFSHVFPYSYFNLSLLMILLIFLHSYSEINTYIPLLFP